MADLRAEYLKLSRLRIFLHQIFGGYQDVFRINAYFCAQTLDVGKTVARVFFAEVGPAD